jgi:hypothetical protein
MFPIPLPFCFALASIINSISLWTTVAYSSVYHTPFVTNTDDSDGKRKRRRGRRWWLIITSVFTNFNFNVNIHE